MNLLNSFSFELPSRIEYGVGVAAKIATELNIFGFKKALLITDRGIVASGLVDRIGERLNAGSIDCDVFDNVEANPKDYNVHEGVEKTAAYGADCLVAVGGGSPIDCAKAISVVATCGGKVRAYEGQGKINTPPLPLVAIPTTAGSGSEVTFSSVITDSQAKFKFSIKDPKIAPRIALVDPEMTQTMPPALTAATGMDALTHAIEAYTCKVAEPLADACALYAVELITRHLKAAFDNGGNIEARAGMLLGSILAAIAFSHSDVAAVHCIAEALGGKYDAPHGVCNAVVLPAVMEYNMAYCKNRYARIATAMGIAYEDDNEGAQLAVGAVKQLATDVDLPDFNSLGVKESDFDELAHNSAVNGSNPDNPRPMDKSDYVTILKQLSMK
jgi:alcohol dehydrogenase